MAGSNRRRGGNQMAKDKGAMPTAPELFIQTKTKVDNEGRRVFPNQRDQEIYDSYMRSVENNPNNKPDNQLWYEAVDGYKKGAVYGVGSAHELFYSPPSRRQSSTPTSYTPGVVSQLQDKLTAQERANAATQEELSQLKEQMKRFESYFASCNPGFSPPNPDPRDPFGGGGGSGASMGTRV